MLILLTSIFLGLTIIFWLSNSYIADAICAYFGGDDESCQCEECQKTSSASTSKKQEETTQK